MIIVVVNMTLGSVHILNPYFRWGIDYQAYIQQAALVYNGERNYNLLSSSLGPCYYPAGHIWHYYLLCLIHYRTEHAESIVKFLHVILHTCTMVFTTKIAYLYFTDSEERLKKQSQWKSMRA